MPPPLPDRQYPKTRSSGNKALIGCGIGCATIIGLVLIAVGFGGWWFFSTEDQVPTDRILNTGSSAAFRLEDISRNQEVMQLISDVFKEAQRINRNRFHEQLPEPFEKFQNYFEGQQDPVQLIKWFSPKEATASFSYDAAGDSVYIIAANFGTGTRMVKMILNTAFENNEHLKSRKISTEHGDLFLIDQRNNWNGDKTQQGILGFYKGTFIFSNGTESVISALDQLADETNSGELNEALSDPYYRMNREGCLAYGVMDGSFFKYPDHGIGPFKGELGSAIKKAEISLDKLSGENGTLNLKTEWNNKEIAVKANEELDKLKPEWIEEAGYNGFDMEIINSLEGEKLDIRFRVNNLKDSLVHLIQDMD
jgi:hypothetical protein